MIVKYFSEKEVLTKSSKFDKFFVIAYTTLEKNAGEALAPEGGSSGQSP